MQPAHQLHRGRVFARNAGKFGEAQLLFVKIDDPDIMGIAQIQAAFDHVSSIGDGEKAIRRGGPDDRILEIYKALRPYRSTKQELIAIADDLEQRYQAKICAAFVREAAELYVERKKLKGDD